MSLDPIPGITLVLRENPLHTKIELSESALREYTYRFALKEMEDMIWDAHFHLNSEKWFDLERVKSDVKEFAEMSDHNEHPDDSFQFWKAFAEKRGLKYFLDALDDEHGGDCTAVACTCMKCCAEDLAGICTLPGGKPICSRISWMFRDGRSEGNDDVGKKVKKIMEEHRQKLALQTAP